MTARSTIAKLPAEIRDCIARLRDDGCTVDQILAKLDELDVDVSRSALGRHTKRLDQVARKIREKREIATALVAKFGDEPDNRLAAANIELMHGLLMDLLTAEPDEDDEEVVEGDPGRRVILDPEQAMFLAKSLQSLASAAKSDQERTIKQREVIKKEMAAKLDQAAKKSGSGLTADTVDLIKKQVLGIS